MTAAETIAAFATSLDLDDVPAEVVEHAKLHVLDTLGCGLAGARDRQRRPRAGRRCASSAASPRRP